VGIIAAISSHAAADPNRIACQGPGFRITYRELVDRVEAAAAALSDAGIDATRRVGVMIANEQDHLVACLGLLRVGAWQITLASHDTPVLRERIAERADLDTCIVCDASEVPAELRTITWPPPQRTGTLADAAEGGILLRTSGTTGDINLVPFSSGDILMQAQRQPEYRNGRLLRPAGIEHNNSKRHRLYCLGMGGTNVFAPAGAYSLAEFCHSQNVTCVDIALMHAAELIAARQPGAFGAVDFRVSGSGMPWPSRQRFIAAVSERLYVRYGATEIGSVSLCRPGEHSEDEGAGIPVPGVTVEIVDEQGQALQAGELGHIRLKAPGIATHYYKGPEQTAKRFRDGWFWPGDMGVLRADGSLVVKGRADDMMILNGLNIFPSEIERVLEQHPAVAVAAAVGLPSRIHGQIPVAVIELRSGESVTPADLQVFARERLALRTPRRILVVEQLPRNSQGKIRRRDLLELFASPTSVRQ
jgi:long-chain acyl-CoA synthetase